MISQSYKTIKSFAYHIDQWLMNNLRLDNRYELCLKIMISQSHEANKSCAYHTDQWLINDVRLHNQYEL